MSETFSTAISLLVIGMITVFVVLTLVVLTGKILIAFVNRFIPELEKSNVDSGDPNNPKIAAITAAVDVVTAGAGQVTRIEQQN